MCNIFGSGGGVQNKYVNTPLRYIIEHNKKNNRKYNIGIL